MANRTSALEQSFVAGHFGAPTSTAVVVTLLESLQLGQICAWPETITEIGATAANCVGAQQAPKPLRSIGDAGQALLRVEPLKWWLIGAELPEINAEQGTVLDLSHSRTRLRLHGDHATSLLNRFIAVNLSEHAFPVGSVVSSSLHHVGLTLWRNQSGYELFIPRGYAVSVWELLKESALQFGLEVVAPE